MSDKKMKTGLFATFQCREDAIKATKDCGTVILIFAAIQTGQSLLVGYFLLLDAAVYAVCGYFIRSKRSRAASIVVLIYSFTGLVVAIVNRAGQDIVSGSQILLTLVIAWAAVRCVEATFKLRGKYAEISGEPG